MNKNYFKLLEKENEINSFITNRTINLFNYNKEEYLGLNLALHVGDNKENIIENREYLAKQIGVNLSDFIFMNQVHDSDVTIIGKSNKGKGTRDLDSAIETDAMITNEPGIVLIVLVADCIPILFYDKIKKVVGVAHAGWKGTNKNIASNVIKKMKVKYDSNPSDILVCFGPSISQESFEVGEEVAKEFPDNFSKQKSNGKYILDLREVNKKQLLDLGVLEKSIEISNEDTFTNENYFSARRLGYSSGRFGVGICMY